MHKSYFNYLCPILLVILISGCGGGSDGIGDSSDRNSTLRGVFSISPVQGLRWISGDQESVTDDTGTFEYEEGSSVEFYVGDIFVGEATGDSVITPIDLVSGADDITDDEVTNIVRFFLTLDNDDDPENGIEITESVSNLALGETVDFSQSTSEFASSTDLLLSNLTTVTDAGARSLVSVDDAQEHAEDSIAELLAGSYRGTISGDTIGTWTGTITTSGQFTGTAVGDETVSFAGTVSTNGSGSTDFETSGGASDGTTFSGTFNPNGTASGSWDYFGAESGTWSGSKTN